MAVADRAAVVSFIEELSDDSTLKEARSSEDEEFLQSHVRIENYFERIKPLYNVSDFLSHFRMSRTTVNCLERLLATCPGLPHGQRNGGRSTIDLQKQVLITIWVLRNPECLLSVADRFNVTKSSFLRVYRRICWAIANNLSGQYMKYLFVWNWAPLGKMISFGSFAQRNTLDQWSNDMSLDRAHQWSDESLSEVDLIDHWSENGFAQKERRISEILIRILPKERTLRIVVNLNWLVRFLSAPKRLR